MIRHPTPRLQAYRLVALLGLLAGLALGRPELVAVAAPAALILTVGLSRVGDLSPAVTVHGGGERALEGDEVGLTVTLRAPVDIRRLDVSLALPDGLVDVAGPRTVRLRAGVPCQLRLRVRCARWGAYRYGAVRLCAPGPLSLFVLGATHTASLPLKVYPQAEALRALLAPLDTQPQLGAVRSRDRGAGIELAELRPFAPGDDARAISWRASARRQALWVTERHPERSGDVVLVVDTLAEVRAGAGGTLDLAVRSAAQLASAHLARRDRVGLVGFGGTVTWLRPGSGDVQRYRVLDALLSSRIVATAVWAGAAAVPPRALPPQALVIGLSPLLDPRAVDAFADLAGRRVDLALVELDAEGLLPPATDERQRIARRLWSLERDAVRRRFQRHGVAVARWRPGQPLGPTLSTLEAFRRAAPRVTT